MTINRPLDIKQFLYFKSLVCLSSNIKIEYMRNSIHNFFLILLSIPCMFSCVSTKKYNSLNVSYEKSLGDNKNCGDQLKNAQSQNADLIK